MFVKVTEVETFHVKGKSGGNTLYINTDHIVQLYRVKYDNYPTAQSNKNIIDVTVMILMPEGEAIRVTETIDQILGDIT